MRISISKYQIIFIVFTVLVLGGLIFYLYIIFPSEIPERGGEIFVSLQEKQKEMKLFTASPSIAEPELPFEEAEREKVFTIPFSLVEPEIVAPEQESKTIETELKSTLEEESTPIEIELQSE